MRILISGATGFVGRNVAERLLKDKHDVFVITRETTDISKLDKRITVIKFNGDVDHLSSFISKEKVDGVIHLASLVLTTHTSSNIASIINSNILFATQLLEASTRSGVSWFINTGTFWQHYKNKKYSPVNLYAASKQAFEDIAQYYQETSSIIFLTIILCDNFGKDDSRPKIFNLLKKIKETKEQLDMSPGEQLLDITHIDNVVDGYIHVIKLLGGKGAKNLSNKRFILGENKRLTLKSFVSLFEKISKTKLNINWGGRNYRDREIMIPYSQGIIIPEWKPKVDLEQGIKRSL